MMQPDDVALDFAIAKAALILIITVIILVYLMHVAMKITSTESPPSRGSRATVSKASRWQRKRSIVFWHPFT